MKGLISFMFITVWLFISLSSLSTGSSVNGDDADQQQRLRGKNKTIRKGNVIREDKSHLFLGAMMILVSNPWQFREGRTCSLPELLDSLQVNWLPHNKYPIILLSEYEWKRETKLKIRGKWPLMDIQFVDISDVWTSMLPNASFVSEDRDKPISPIQYKQMCAFMTKGFTEVPMLKRYRYLLRLDDDVCIQSPINYDMFEEMKNAKAMYAYPQMFLDHIDTTVGLVQFAEDYMASNSIPWANPELHAKVLEFQATHKVVISFFNFEIFDMVRYRQPDIMGFVDALVSSEMIFHRRWGDSAIKFLFAYMFWHRDEVYQLCDFDYQHSSWSPLKMCDHRRYEDSILFLLNHTRVFGSDAYTN